MASDKNKQFIEEIEMASDIIKDSKISLVIKKMKVKIIKG